MKIKGAILGVLFLILMIVIILPSIYLILFNSVPVKVDLLLFEAESVHLGTLLLLTWLVASFAGFLAGIGIPGLVGRYLETRKLEKKVDSLEQELSSLKAAQVKQNGK